uniref:IPT/TIG domain-containing protein n=1 Tax=Solibacter usitatus (strain Ellin6076) TaxID=234267 RepID=Q01WT5_SOLUE
MDHRCIFALVLALLPCLGAQTRSYALFTFDAPGSNATAVSAMNNAGEMVGSYHDAAGDHAFLRHTDGSFSPIDLPGAVAGRTSAIGINNAGQIVGAFTDSSGTHGFLRAPDGTFTTLEAGYSPAGINDHGDIVGTASAFTFPTLGYLRTSDGHITTFQAPGASQTWAAGLNNDGQIVGTYITGGSYSIGHGFLRAVDGSFTTLDVPGLEPRNMGTWAASINNRGQIAGYLLSYGYSFVRDADGTYTLVTGLGQTYAHAIDDNARLGGYVYDAGGTHGLLATLSGAGGPAPAIRAPLGVSSAAAFGGLQGIAPGTWIEIYGVNLARTTRSWQGSDFTGDNAPTTLDGVSVTVNGQPAYVSYISPGQVNAQVPATLGPETAQVVVIDNGQRTAPYTVKASALLPGIAAFPSESYSSVPLAITLPPDPVKAGDVITFFGIGFGDVTPSVPAGRITREANTLTSSVEITFDGVPAKVLYAGLSPGSVGLYQFNVVVPDSGTPMGDSIRYVGIVVRANGTSVPTVNLRIRQ